MEKISLAAIYYPDSIVFNKAIEIIGYQNFELSELEILKFIGPVGGFSPVAFADSYNTFYDCLLKRVESTFEVTDNFDWVEKNAEILTTIMSAPDGRYALSAIQKLSKNSETEKVIDRLIMKMGNTSTYKEAVLVPEKKKFFEKLLQPNNQNDPKCWHIISQIHQDRDFATPDTSVINSMQKYLKKCMKKEVTQRLSKDLTEFNQLVIDKATAEFEKSTLSHTITPSVPEKKIYKL